jgi:hypothetical protein
MARKVAAQAGLAIVAYEYWVRPRLMRWGATEEETTGPYPHAELVHESKRSPTMAVTIGAPPEQVWPWLVQMGWDRGGWYSWDRLDNAGRPSATKVHPEWQDAAVGDQLAAQRVARREHSPGCQRVPDIPTEVDRTLCRRMGASAGLLDHAGANAGRAEAKY